MVATTVTGHTRQDASRRPRVPDHRHGTTRYEYGPRLTRVGLPRATTPTTARPAGVRG